MVSLAVCNHEQEQEFLATDLSGIRCGQCFYEGYVKQIKRIEQLESFAREAVEVIRQYHATIRVGKDWNVYKEGENVLAKSAEVLGEKK